MSEETTGQLSERERKFAAALSPSARAKRLYPKLLEEARECTRDAKIDNGSRAELLHLRSELLEQAAELLRVLETEQFRQRTAADTFLQGRMDRHELRSITRSWNAT